MPVQLRDCTPGPKYSMMKPVPPCTCVSQEYFAMFTMTYPDGQLASQFQDHILWRCPSAEFSGKLHTQDLGCLQLPWRIHKSVDRIGTTNTNCNRSQTSSIR